MKNWLSLEFWWERLVFVRVLVGTIGVCYFSGGETWFSLDLWWENWLLLEFWWGNLVFVRVLMGEPGFGTVLWPR